MSFFRTRDLQATCEAILGILVAAFPEAAIAATNTKKEEDARRVADAQERYSHYRAEQAAMAAPDNTFEPEVDTSRLRFERPPTSQDDPALGHSG